MQVEKQASQIDAVVGSDGLIEITSLDLLDDVVGGLVDPDTVFFDLGENEGENF